jgi:hypothetical protein
VLRNDGSVSADWVTSSAVVAEERSVAAETGEVVGAAGVLLLGGTVEDVVGLVGSVHDIAPEECGTNGLTGGRCVVEAGRDKGAATRSAENVTNDVSTLRVAVDYNVCARTLLVESGDLRNAVSGTLGDLVAVVGTKSDIELDVDVVAGLALGSELAAGGLDEGEGAAIVVRRIVTASHEDDYIGTWSLELRRSDLSGGERRESANGESLADGRHY